MGLNQKNIFLLDGIGATLSACFTGLILTRYTLFLGLNVSLLQSLAIIPAIFALYSFSCYFFVTRVKPWMLMFIICGNLTYCLISLALIVFRDRITWRAQVLLGAEVLIVFLVVLLELRVYRNFKS